jgi:hypothetical protein
VQPYGWRKLGQRLGRAVHGSRELVSISIRHCFYGALSAPQAKLAKHCRVSGAIFILFKPRFAKHRRQ